MVLSVIPVPSGGLSADELPAASPFTEFLAARRRTYVSGRENIPGLADDDGDDAGNAEEDEDVVVVVVVGEVVKRAVETMADGVQAGRELSRERAEGEE